MTDAIHIALRALNLTITDSVTGAALDAGPADGAHASTPSPAIEPAAADAAESRARRLLRHIFSQVDTLDPFPPTVTGFDDAKPAPTGDIPPR